MFPVHLLVGVPLPRQERMPAADDLAVKVRHHRGEVVGEVVDLEVAAEVGAVQIHLLRPQATGE